MQMRLNWIKCTEDRWCPFTRVNLSHPHFIGLEGVYVVWHSGNSPATVYVGQGKVAQRIQEHRSDNRILVYSHIGLFVTWSQVESAYRDGVERYLIDTLNPKVTQARPNVNPMPVNLPWS